MPLLPLKDDNPVVYIRYQYVTVSLIGACVAVFLWQLGLSEAALTRFVLDFGVSPAALLQGSEAAGRTAGLPSLFTLLTYPFLHGGWLHLIGNLLFLWVFADNVEDALGHGRFLLFYFACGIAAALAHLLLSGDSLLPMIGASGAISGVLGAYLLRHPHARVLVLAYLPIPLRLPTYVVLGLWLGVNLAQALMGGDEGVAWWAHLGGFAAGMVLVGPLSPRRGVGRRSRAAGARS